MKEGERVWGSIKLCVYVHLNEFLIWHPILFEFLGTGNFQLKLLTAHIRKIKSKKKHGRRHIDLINLLLNAISAKRMNDPYFQWPIYFLSSIKGIPSKLYWSIWQSNSYSLHFAAGYCVLKRSSFKTFGTATVTAPAKWFRVQAHKKKTKVSAVSVNGRKRAVMWACAAISKMEMCQ